MNTLNSRLNSFSAQLATLLGTASLLTMAGAIASQDRAYAGEAAGAEEIPENVLITGSLIRGTVAVGVPVVNLSPMDFAATGSLTTADLFKNFPAANVNGGEVGTESGARVERGAKVNLRGLDTGDAVRSLMMVDGMRFPPQSNGLCAIDPSIIPSISLDHIDILVDGASATYGSDAISGVVNLILRRNYDGAMTQFRYSARTGGGARYQFGQLWGRTWDGGQITMSYEWYEEVPVKANALSNFGIDHSPWGYDNKTTLASSTPGTITRSPFPGGANAIGTGCGYNTGVSPNTASSCYAIPLGTGTDFPVGTIGPTSPYSASTLNWATLSTDSNYAGPLNPSAGTRNQYNPYSRTWYDAVEQRSGGHITVDQRLTKDISLYGSSFYSNRRAKFLVPSTLQPAANNVITQIGVPTSNPYYPTGGAPTNLRISYDIGIEAPAQVDAYEVAARYQVGLNIALPAGWESQVFYSETYDSSYNHITRAVNKNGVSAALGWTIASVAPSGTGPSFGTWTKPANVPYLNLFCDPTQFQCNSATTLNYISGYRSINERFWINEKGIKADGPLFDLPGGTVKMAIGADLSSYRFSSVSQDNTGGANLTINPQYDPEGRFVWATFAQINIPVFSEMNAIFGARRFDVELSWRHDQYSDVGGTSNPKIAFNWAPIEDFTIKGAWGSNFRAPVFGETSPVANVNIQGWNLGGTLANAANVISTCSGVGAALPNAASGAGKLQQAALDFNNAMAASGVAGYSSASGCLNNVTIPDPGSYTDAAGNVFTSFASIANLIQPGGVSTLGGALQAVPIRQFTGNGLLLKPELATNWGIGFDYTPTNFLRGLDIQATYYIVKINGVLRSFGNPNDGRFADPQIPFAWPTPSDIGCPALPNSVRPSIPIPANLVPSACPQWMTAVAGLMSNPRSQVSPQAQTAVYWINDGSVFNQGWLKLDGIDWNWSYDWDMGDVGAFNIGAAGTYYLHNFSETTPGAPGSAVTDGFHTTVGSSNAESHGVATLPPLKYRARLGWSSGPWSVTGFMDYISHYKHTQSAPPNVNGNFCTSTAFGAPGGGTFPCFQDQYDNGVPPWYSFDLSVGYDTGDDPANNYLKNIGLQLIIQNIFDKHSDYQYKGTNTGGSGCTCNNLRPDYGRQFSIILTKTW